VPTNWLHASWALLVKNLSDFFQMGPRRSGFDFECGVFRSDLILNKFKRMGLIRCLILNVTIVYFVHTLQHDLVGLCLDVSSVKAGCCATKEEERTRCSAQD